MSGDPHEPRAERPRRLVPAALALLALLALAALAASGRPLGIGGGGSGPSATFIDFGWTTALVVIVLWVATVIWYLVSSRGGGLPLPQPGRWWISIPLYVTFVSALILLLHYAHLTPFHPPRTQQPGTPANPNADLLGRHPKGPTHTAHVRWEELLVVTLALALFAVWLRSRRGEARRLSIPRRRAAEVAVALDEAVDDLRNEPDVRRAIIAAYARTERALAAHGLPRHHAEAPLEYLARALGALDASAASIRRLTDLFEWAKFSRHEPEPARKDEAIDALLAVRDELRAGSQERVAA